MGISRGTSCRDSLSQRENTNQDILLLLILLFFLNIPEQRRQPQRPQSSRRRNRRRASESQDAASVIQEKYRGAFLQTLLENGLVTEGEVVFDFEDIIVLKKDNHIIFVTPENIDAFL